MDALYIFCGARRPQLKRDPLGGGTNIHVGRELSHYLIVSLAAVGCMLQTQRRSELTHPCAYPSSASAFDSAHVEELAGDYNLTLVADSFPSPGAATSGQLSLRVNTDTLRRRYVFSVLWQQWHRFGERPLVGTAAIDLGRVYAPVSRDPRSTDPDAPGVYFEQAYGEFRVGVQPNSSDGTSTELAPAHVWSDGFQGHWTPDYGIATLVDSSTGKPAHLGGVFCAIRI
jgi:hypothetical protein